MHIALIGFRGTGKTTVARHLALALGWNWVDTDVEVELRAGKSIKALFDEDGEPHFRDLEAAVLVDLAQVDRRIIATGGGIVLRPQNRQVLKQLGNVVWLAADVETIAHRIDNDPTTTERRPGLTQLSSRAEIEHLLAEREPLYRDLATCVVHSGGRSADDIAAQILAQLDLPNPPRAQP